MQFQITVDDAAQLAGLTFARDQFNAALTLAEGQAIEDHPDYLPDDQAYVQRVMSRACESYAKQAHAAGVQAVVKQATDDGMSVADVQAAVTAGKS